MKNKVITHHKERSALFVAHLRASTKLSNTKIEEAVRSVYRDLKRLDSAPARDTVLSFLSGKRNIPFDPPNQMSFAWLMCAELMFPGCCRYFFHPMPNLLAGPLLSSEKWETFFRTLPDEWLEEDDLEERRRNKVIRKRRKNNEPFNKLEWIHTKMFRTDYEVRNLLMTDFGEELGWARRYGVPESERDQLISIGGLEALTGAIALWLEASVIRDLNRSICAKAAIESLLPILKTSPLFKKVRGRYLVEIENLLEWHEFSYYKADDLMRSAHPVTWSMLPDCFPIK